MNKPFREMKNSAKEKDFFHMMYFGKHKVQPWVAYLTLGTLTAALFALISTLGVLFQAVPHSPEAVAVEQLHKPAYAPEKYGKTSELISKLQKYGLWEINPFDEVPRFFIKRYPADLHDVEDMAIRKRVFLHSLLPHALLVRQEALHERGRLESILRKIDCSLEDISFDTGPDSESQCLWSSYLSEDEVVFIRYLCSNYRTTTADGLLNRVDAVPTSIILAQGALESSWGGSRFTREGNSVFGMWTWKTKGMVPAKRDKGKTHKVKAYENVLDSVRAYHLTLNRLDSYNQFRQLRSQSDDPLMMAEGLILYSERGEAYVNDIKNVILSNDLKQYDRYSLSDNDLPEPVGWAPKTTVIARSDKSSS